jgi:hypothetical protein
VSLIKPSIIVQHLCFFIPPQHAVYSCATLFIVFVILVLVDLFIIVPVDSDGDRYVCQHVPVCGTISISISASIPNAILRAMIIPLPTIPRESPRHHINFLLVSILRIRMSSTSLPMNNLSRAENSFSIASLRLVFCDLEDEERTNALT